MNWTILSSCGTSLLTNGADENLRKLVIQKSNEKFENSIASEDLEKIKTRIEAVKAEMANASKEEASRKSAELNAIVKLYSERDRHWGNKQDFQWLICTDTWLGEITANLVKDWLESQGFVVQVYRQADLQTQTINEFQLALSDLTKWCYENLPSPLQEHSNVFFNLTGGFKSVNGFLQTLGMFRADEVVYIFEGEKKLLSIPRLPIELTSKNVIRENFVKFRRLALGLQVENPNDIPQTFLLKIDESYSLSAWGEIQWKELRNEIYSEKLFDSPDKIAVISDAVKSMSVKYPQKIYEMNDQIDKLILYLKSNNQKHIRSLNFQEVQSKKDIFEFKAWDDGQGFRFFGHYEGGVFVIDKLQRGLHP